MKKHASTLVMVVIAAALGLWLWFDRDHVTAGEHTRRENNVFPAWRPEELTEVTVVHDGETLVLARDVASARSTESDHEGRGKESPWRMLSPREERVDPVAVQRLLTTLEFATVARKVSDGGGLGLDSPRAAGTLRMGSLVVSFALGGESPRPPGSSYLRVGQDPPVVVTKELAEALLAASDVYRDRTVVPYLATELARFEVRSEGGGFALDRIDARSFRVADSGLLASRGAVDAIWAALAEMRAEGFPKDADVERLTARPALTITMTPKDHGKPPAEMLVGEQCPGYPADVVVLRRAPSRVAACAPRAFVRALLVTGASMSERRPFSVRMDEIEEVRLEWTAKQDGTGSGSGALGMNTHAPAAVELARKGTGFHEREPVDRDLAGDEADAATDWLTRLADSEADSAAHGGGPFTAVARARVRSGEHEEIVEIGAVDARGHVMLRRLLDDGWLDAGPAVARRLVPRDTTLRPRVMLAPSSARPAVRVLLRCGTDQELVDRGDGFRLVSPPGYETDGAITQLVDAVLRGHVDAWVADADDGTFGLAQRDGCHVVLAFQDGNGPVTMWLGDEGEGGVYGRVDVRPGVFVAPRTLRELASRIYVSRASLRAEATRIDRVHASFEGRTAVRDQDTLRAAVSGLYADRVVALGRAFLAPSELTLEVSLAEAGAPRRIGCRASGPKGAPRDAGPAASRAGEWLCVQTGLDATFAFPDAKIAPFTAGTEASQKPAR